MSNSQEYAGLTDMQLAMIRAAQHNDKSNIIDLDAHFTVDVKNKLIVATDKRKLVQFSHNSERITFDCDRYIEGHDVTLCNVKQIHYLEDGVYDIDDLTVNEDDRTKVTFSWLISGNVTKEIIESVPFSLLFECVKFNGDCTYSWATEENKSLYVVKGRRNSNSVAYTYADILAQWRQEFEQTMSMLDDVIWTAKMNVVSEDINVFDETSIKFTTSSAIVNGFAKNSFVEGYTYIVTWNGTEYEAQCYAIEDGSLSLGNGTLGNSKIETEHPFFINNLGGTGCFVFKETSNTETVTLKVRSIRVEEYNKLPKEFLPDDMEVDAGNIFVVNVTSQDNDLAADKTLAEILQANQDGALCIAKNGSGIYLLQGVSSTMADFYRVYNTYISTDLETREETTAVIITDKLTIHEKDITIDHNILNVPLGVDDELDETSVNPVRNSVVTKEIKNVESRLTKRLLACESIMEVDGSETLVFPADLSDKPNVMEMVYLISDSTPTAEDFENGVSVTVVAEAGSAEFALMYQAEEVSEGVNLIIFGDENDQILQGYVIPYDGFELEGIAFESKGIYVVINPRGASYYELKINGFVFGGGYKVKNECIDHIIPSSTPGSTKKFRITVDDSGTISATEVTE